MAFLDEGTPRWDTCRQGGSGVTVVNSLTEENLLVKGSKPVGEKYERVALTNAATDVIKGVTAGQDDFNSDDPYELTEFGICRVKTAQKLRVRTATAYVAANYGKGINPDATTGQEGWATVAATGGTGRIAGGETIGTGGTAKHYLDFWMDEASPR